MSEKSPAFQFYPKDVLSDGDAMALPSQLFGMYMKLLCFDWIDDGIKDSESVWFRLGGHTPESITDRDEAVEFIRKKFVPHPTKAGYITHPRLLKERAKQADNSQKAQDAANKRWHGTGDANAKPKHKTADASALPTQCTSSSISSSSSSPKINTNTHVPSPEMVKVGQYAHIDPISLDAYKMRFSDKPGFLDRCWEKIDSTVIRAKDWEREDKLREAMNCAGLMSGWIITAIEKEWLDKAKAQGPPKVDKEAERKERFERLRREAQQKDAMEAPK